MVAEVVIKEKVKELEEPKKTGLVGWIAFILILAAIFLCLRFVVGFIAISGNSMNPTLEDGNIVLTSNLFYTVERNDIVIFRDDNGFNVIKRVIGLPHDTIAIQNGTVFVNGVALEESFREGQANDMNEIVVPDNSYFVMGDNRTPGESLDSRSEKIGPIPEQKILGELMISLFPLSVVDSK